MGRQMLKFSFPQRLNRAVRFYNFRESKHIVQWLQEISYRKLLNLEGFRLREKVYDSIFFSTTIRFGEWPTCRFLGTCPSYFRQSITCSRVNAPLSTTILVERLLICRFLGQIGMKNRNLATHSLALLRVCRQIYEETKSLWLGRILFDFNHVITLLDKLSLLPDLTLSRIRFIRVSADPLVLRVEGQNHHPFFRLLWALKMLPGLRLDTLTVLGTYYGPLDYLYSWYFRTTWQLLEGATFCHKRFFNAWMQQDRTAQTTTTHMEPNPTSSRRY